MWTANQPERSHPYGGTTKTGSVVVTITCPCPRSTTPTSTPCRGPIRISGRFRPRWGRMTSSNISADTLPIAGSSVFTRPSRAVDRYRISPHLPRRSARPGPIRAPRDSPFRWPVPGSLSGGATAGRDPDVRQGSIPLPVIEAVPDHPDVGDLEPEVIDPHVRFPAGGLAEQRAAFQGRGPAQRQQTRQIAERVAGVDDVLDDQDVFSRDVGPQIRDQTHGAFGSGGGPVGGHGEEVDASRDRQRPGEVREEDETPPEHADHVQIVRPGVLFGDPSPQLPDATPDRIRVDEDLRRPAERHRYSTTGLSGNSFRSSPIGGKCSARWRVTSRMPSITPPSKSACRKAASILRHILSHSCAPTFPWIPRSATISTSRSASSR